jgi:hypothetical protein
MLTAMPIGTNDGTGAHEANDGKREPLDRIPEVRTFIEQWRRQPGRSRVP